MKTNSPRILEWKETQPPDKDKLSGTVLGFVLGANFYRIWQEKTEVIGEVFLYGEWIAFSPSIPTHQGIFWRTAVRMMKETAQKHCEKTFLPAFIACLGDFKNPRPIPQEKSLKYRSIDDS